ncbi:MAG TPA: hypothetical protein DCS93_14565 [Microscillaceae bacterium]|nr:hypothetical protein [Microscillaceae bacterium]
MIKYNYEYTKLGDITYNLLRNPQDIKSYLLEFILKEWEIDRIEAPDQPWTVEWMDSLKAFTFALQQIDLSSIKLKPDLMAYEKDGESFVDDLQERVEEREESFLRGLSFEPLLVNGHNFELMDGYTRYMLFNKYHQKQVYAYVGHDH